MENSDNESEAKKEGDKGFEGPFIPRRVEQEVLIALHSGDPCEGGLILSQRDPGAPGVAPGSWRRGISPVVKRLSDFLSA